MPKSLQPVLNNTMTRSFMDWGVLTLGIVMLAVAVTGTFVAPGDANGADQALNAYQSHIAL